MPAARRAPLGVRGAPAGPRADLGQIDTGHLTHQLYVKVAAAGDQDPSRAITVQVLRYVHDRLDLFAQMGIAVKVNRISSQMLRDQRVLDGMQRRGINRLPALTTPNNVYIGLKQICEVYERNINEFAAVGRREEKPAELETEEDELAKFYQDEMTFDRAEEDAQETGIGESEDMMDSHRRMMERREASESGRRRPPAGGRPAADAPDGARRAGGHPPADARRAPPAARPAVSTRPDNLGRGARALPENPEDPEEAEFQATIDRLSGDIDAGTRERAFAVAGGDSLDDDGASDVQDDLMERAYYANLTASDM